MAREEHGARAVVSGRRDNPVHLMQCDEFCDNVTAASQGKLRVRHMSSKAHVEKVACCITKRDHIVLGVLEPGREIRDNDESALEERW